VDYQRKIAEVATFRQKRLWVFEIVRQCYYISPKWRICLKPPRRCLLIEYSN